MIKLDATHASEASLNVSEKIVPFQKNDSSMNQAVKRNNQEYRLDAWIKKCFETLPEFKQANACYSLKILPTTLSIEEIINTIKNFIDQFEKNTANFKSKDTWMPGHAPSEKLCVQKENAFIHPYVQKLIIPNDSCICFMGDIHGSIHSLLRNLSMLLLLGYIDNTLKIIDKKNHPFYMIFTGDYVDRGCWSVEVWYTLMILKLVNFDRVFLLRGNHEDKNICTFYGFKDELRAKFYSKDVMGKKSPPMPLETLFDFYCTTFELLPLALYLGTKGENDHISYIQCCHGGIEPFYNPISFLTADKNITFDLIFQHIPIWPSNTIFTQLLLDELMQAIKTIIPPISWQCGLGFLWGDFEENNLLNSQHAIRYNPARGITATTQATQEFLTSFNEQLKTNNMSMHAFFRGHQHNAFGLKIGNTHWTDVVTQRDNDETGFSIASYGPIFTFSTAAEGVELPYDCFGILTLNTKYENWRLKPYERLKK